MPKPHTQPGKIFSLFLAVSLLLGACRQVLPAQSRESGVPRAIAPAAPRQEIPPTKPAMNANPNETVKQTAVAEKLAARVESVVYAQGTVDPFVLPGCFDFDRGVISAPPDTACDFNFLPGAPDSGTIEVFPIESSHLAYGGVFPQAPTKAECGGSQAFSNEREIVTPMASMYVCYQTGEGRLGYLHFTGADLEQTYTLAFDWLTFAN
jgi:hypothetical protein